MLNYFIAYFRVFLFTRMADETPAVVVVTPGDESVAEAASDIQRAADATLETAKELAREMVWSQDEKARVISELNDLRGEVRDLAARNAEQHALLVAMLESLADDVEDAEDEAADAADAAAAAALSATETPTPEVAAAAAVSDAAATVAEAAAEESKPAKRRRGWL